MIWRNLILGLLLANLLVFAWKSWIVPPPVPDPTAYAGASEPRLVLVEPAARKPRPPASAGPRERCVRLGPFAEVDTADAVARQLSARGLRVGRASEAGQVWVGHWVQLLDLASYAEAESVVARLADAGLADAYIVQRDPTVNVSLGVFRSRDGAGEVIDLARGMGLEPTTTDRYRSGTEHWITVEAVGAEDLDVTDLSLGAAQILRIEQRDCGDAAVADGDAAGDSIESRGPADESPATPE